jgi:uncharacterized membrane protein
MSPFSVSTFSNSTAPHINNPPRLHLTAGIDASVQLEILNVVCTIFVWQYIYWWVGSVVPILSIKSCDGNGKNCLKTPCEIYFFIYKFAAWFVLFAQYC